MLPIALTILSLQAPQAPKRLPQSEATVVVQDRALEIPRLPKDASEGRSGFNRVHAQIQSTQSDLSEALRFLYGKPEATQPLPRELTVPEAFAEEGTHLLDLLQDTRYSRLESDYAEAWKGWQAGLVEGGLASPVHVKGKVAERRSEIYEATKRKALEVIKARTRTMKRATGGLHASYNVENAGLFDDGPGPTEDAHLGDEKLRQSVHLAQVRQTVSDSLIPTLAGAWNPLVAHLGAQAQRVGELEAGAGPCTDGTLNALRIRAKIAVLERFRAVLWYCDLVWCQLAPADAPAPPVRLRAGAQG